MSPRGENVRYSDPLSSYKDDFLNLMRKITKETMEEPRPESRAIETQHNALLIKLSGLKYWKDHQMYEKLTLYLPVFPGIFSDASV